MSKAHGIKGYSVHDGIKLHQFIDEVLLGVLQKKQANKKSAAVVASFKLACLLDQLGPRARGCRRGKKLGKHDLVEELGKHDLGVESAMSWACAAIPEDLPDEMLLLQHLGEEQLGEIFCHCWWASTCSRQG